MTVNILYINVQIVEQFGTDACYTEKCLVAEKIFILAILKKISITSYGNNDHEHIISKLVLCNDHTLLLFVENVVSQVLLIQNEVSGLFSRTPMNNLMIKTVSKIVICLWSLQLRISEVSVVSFQVLV